MGFSTKKLRKLVVGTLILAVAASTPLPANGNMLARGTGGVGNTIPSAEMKQLATSESTPPVNLLEEVNRIREGHVATPGCGLWLAPHDTTFVSFVATAEVTSLMASCKKSDVILTVTDLAIATMPLSMVPKGVDLEVSVQEKTSENEQRWEAHVYLCLNPGDQGLPGEYDVQLAVRHTLLEEAIMIGIGAEPLTHCDGRQVHGEVSNVGFFKVDEDSCRPEPTLLVPCDSWIVDYSIHPCSGLFLPDADPLITAFGVSGTYVENHFGYPWGELALEGHCSRIIAL